MESIAVIGAGSWGTALALQMCRQQHSVRLWGHDPTHIERLCHERENRAFLPGFRLPDLITPVARLSEAMDGVHHVIIVVPSQFFAATLHEMVPWLPDNMGCILATKGFDPTTGQLLHQVASNILGDRPFAVLSGPSFATEVAQGLPTAVTIAATDLHYAEKLASLIHGEYFRVYVHNDIIGVQVGGAAKNVLAIATGIADGLGFGANTRSALITRGLAELMRLGLALGAKSETFMGLAGLGDLVLTCTDNQSRNRRLGLALARGLTMQQALAEIGQEIEGIVTSRAVKQLAQQYMIDMPIAEQVYAVLYEARSPREATQHLLDRVQKAELD
jgi:glycerol-3-phosphate dehydrogenase (NAD(P)+)